MLVDLNKIKVISLTLLILSSIVYILAAIGIILLLGFKFYFDPLQLKIDPQAIKIAYAIGAPIYLGNVLLGFSVKDIPEFNLKGDRWNWIVNLGILAILFAFVSTFIFPPMEIGLKSGLARSAVDLVTLEIETKQYLWKNCLRASLIIFWLMSINVHILLNFTRPLDSKEEVASP